MNNFKKALLLGMASGVVAFGAACNDRREVEPRRDLQRTERQMEEKVDEAREDTREGIGGAGREGEIGDGKIGDREGVINDGEGPLEEGQRPMNGNGILEGGDGVDNGK